MLVTVKYLLSVEHTKAIPKSIPKTQTGEIVRVSAEEGYLTYMNCSTCGNTFKLLF